MFRIKFLWPCFCCCCFILFFIWIKCWCPLADNSLIEHHQHDQSHFNKKKFYLLVWKKCFFFMYQPNDNHRQNVIVKRLHILRSSVYRFSFSIYTFSKKSIQIAWQQYYFHYCWFVLCKIWFSVVFIGSKSSSDDHVIYRIICNVYIFVVYFFNAFNASVYINSLIILVLD